MDRIHLEDEPDLIKRLNLKWFKQQLEKVILPFEQQ